MITIITIIRRRDATQPKNHRRSSWLPVAFAPLLGFFHLLLLLLLSLSSVYSTPVDSSSAVPLDSSLFGDVTRRRTTARCVFSHTTPATLIGKLSREIMHCSALVARSLARTVCTHARTHAHVYIRTYALTRIYVCVCVCVYTHTRSLNANSHSTTDGNQSEASRSVGRMRNRGKKKECVRVDGDIVREYRARRCVRRRV